MSDFNQFDYAEDCDKWPVLRYEALHGIGDKFGLTILLPGGRRSELDLSKDEFSTLWAVEEIRRKKRQPITQPQPVAPATKETSKYDGAKAFSGVKKI